MLGVVLATESDKNYWRRQFVVVLSLSLRKIGPMLQRRQYLPPLSTRYHLARDNQLESPKNLVEESHDRLEADH